MSQRNGAIQRVANLLVKGRHAMMPYGAQPIMVLVALVNGAKKRGSMTAKITVASSGLTHAPNCKMLKCALPLLVHAALSGNFIAKTT